MSDLGMRPARLRGLPVPPDDVEMHAYLAGPQHRWVIVVAFIAFVGVAVSLTGLALRTSWTTVLLVPVALIGVEQLLALRTSTFRRRVSLPDHQAVVELWQPPTVPSVDVLLPSAGEDLVLLANTFGHVRRLAWPGEMRIVVLDDSARASVRALADQHGFEYLAREGREAKKAGNLQHGLQHTDGDHVLVLDADFVPRPEMLRHLVPYLDDPSIGIVQSPQFFDTSRELGWLQRAAGATQELFYRIIQPSRDAVAAAMCVGTSAVYRREALAVIGGFPQVEHSEDVATGLLMARRGFSVQYVPIVLSTGTCPEDVDAFLAQQYRWCDGSLAQIADSLFHDTRTMGVAARASYWAGFLYFASTALMAVLGPLPLLIMLYAFPESVRNVNLLPLVGALALWLVVLPAVSHGRWRVEVLRVQLLYGWAHLFCILDACRGRAMEWVATGATSPSSTTRRMTTTIGAHLGVSLVLIVVGLAFGAGRYGLWAYAGTIAMSLLYAYVTVPVLWASVRSLGRTRSHVVDLREPGEAIR